MDSRSVEARASPGVRGARVTGSAARPRAEPRSKGPLLAASAVSLARIYPSPELDSLVRHYWIPRWDLPDGADVRQDVLDYPSMNLVVEPHDARLYRALRGRSTQVLTGAGWGFGVLMQPGAGRRLLGVSARSVPGTGVPLIRLAVPGGDDLARAVRTANSRAAPHHDEANSAMIAAFEEWLGGLELPVDPEAERIRAIVAAVEADRSLLRVDDLAGRFGIGVRHLQRLVTEYVGFGPKWLIQRYRLQEAARALEDAAPPRIADLAAALGYADQAHFGREFKTVVGVPPREYLAAATRRHSPESPE